MTKKLRWYIAGLLMLATTINYLDRQALSVAQPVLRETLGFSSFDYGNITSSFLLAYGLMLPIAGRMIDWLGTRWGFALAVTWWSLANIGHAFAGSVRSFCVFRVLLGIGEAGNFPGSVKAISEWFPPKERTVATGIFNLGAGTGAVIAPPLVGWIILRWGWQAAFVTTGSIGFVWVVLWLLLYHEPEKHPRLSSAELKHIQQEPIVEMEASSARGAWRETLSRREVWPLMIARALADPVWIFYFLWLPDYLHRARGFELKDIALFAWVPFLAADLGSLLGGLLSAFFVKRGFSVLNARLLAMAICASLMPMAIWAGLTVHWQIALACISIAAFGHQSWAASLITLPADLFPKRIVASAYGIPAMFGYFAGAVFNWNVGYWVDSIGYVPIFMAVAFMHLIATAVLFWGIRPPAGSARLGASS